MKGKFRLMWRVGLALVLALSLSLVMAVPVSADVSQPEVTVAPTTPTTAAIYTIEFTTNEDLASGDGIIIEFPTGTDITAITDAVDADVTVNTVQHASAQVGQRLSIILGAALAAGDITVEVGNTNKVTNPGDGDYTLKVYTSQEPTAVTSETYIISKALTDVNQPTLTPTTVGATATYAIPFTTIEDLRIGDAIVIEFPVDTDISAVVAGDVTGVTVASTSVNGQVLTITLGGDLGAGAQTVTIANHIINPTTLLNPETDTNEWKLTIYTTYGHRIPALSVAYSLTAGTVVSQVGWSTVDEYVPNATPSTAFKIQTQTQYGNAAAVGASDVTFTLTASSGAFYEEIGCTTVITTIIIPANNSESAAFYYKGTTATVGTVTITADELVSQGWTMASTTILVNPKLELWGGGELKASYATFALAIAAALPYDTIKVAASTYDGFTVNKDYLTIESTDGAASTTIDASASDAVAAIEITASGVTLGGEGTGFTIIAEDRDSTNPTLNHMGIYLTGAVSDVTIEGNVITGGDLSPQLGILIGTHGKDETYSNIQILNNAFNTTWDVEVTEDNPTCGGIRSWPTTTLDGALLLIDDNDITGFTVGMNLEGYTTGASGTAPAIISNNTVYGNGYNGISVDQGTWVEICGNHIYDNGGNGVAIAVSATEEVKVEQNDIHGNGNGVKVYTGCDASHVLVQYNDIYDNTNTTVTTSSSGTPLTYDNYGVLNAGTGDLDATNNYWGDATGPSAGTGTYASAAVGSGDAVSVNVTYSPWLNVSGGGATITDTITLQTGWNLISLPLIPVDSDIDTVLAGAGTGVTVNKVAYFTGGPAGSWLYYNPPPAPSDLTTMNDGKGYWIDVSAGGSITVIGVELALPGLAPPTYDVVVGWNLIGLTSTGTKDADIYLGSVWDTVEAMYEYDADSGLYTAITTANKTLNPSHGYWLAVNTAGKIYP